MQCNPGPARNWNAQQPAGSRRDPVLTPGQRRKEMEQHKGKLRSAVRAIGGVMLAAGLAAAGALLAPPGARAGDTKFDSDSLGNLTARAIGPAVMGGRIAAIDAYPGDKVTVY